MVSVAERMRAAGNRPSGFDYMRLGLATAVILAHTFSAAYGNPLVLSWWAGPERVMLGWILPPFFALSGFLVAGSLERTNSLISFLGLRVIRLIPALAVEITLSALILGPIFTTLHLSAYFTDLDFSRYFLNIVGDIHYFLPGTFKNNPSQLVNQQLWTVPFEMKCYAALSALAVLGVASRRNLLLCVAVLAQVAICLRLMWHGPSQLGLITGNVLVGCFLAGLLIFKFRDKIPHNFWLFIACLCVMLILLAVPGGDQLLFAPAAYATVWVGTLNPPRQRILLSGDYSYGLFLYGFPIQQAVASLGAWTHYWWINMLTAYPAAILFAAFSWWCIERPALGLKRYLVHYETAALRFPPLRWHSERVFSGKQAASG